MIAVDVSHSFTCFVILYSVKRHPMTRRAVLKWPEVEETVDDHSAAVTAVRLAGTGGAARLLSAGADKSVVGAYTRPLCGSTQGFLCDGGCVYMDVQRGGRGC